MFKQDLILQIMENVTTLMKDELTGTIMIENAALKPNTYSYFMDDGNENKKTKDTKKCTIKRKRKST